MENRAIENIKKGVQKGKNMFILYGEYIHDWFLYDLYNGVCGIEETYKNYFLKEAGYDYYVYCKNDVFKVYRIDDSNIKECNDELFQGSFAEDDDAAGLSLDNHPQSNRKREDDGNAADSARAAASSEERNSLIRFLEICRANRNTKYAVFMEDYEWTTGLYKSSNDEELGYIEKIKELAALKNTLIVITIEEMQMLQKYNFKLDGNNVCMIGSPTAEEIYYAYLRRYTKKYTDANLNNSFFKNLKEIAEAVASGEKTLMGSLRIFDKVLTEHNGEINKEYFNDALDKQIEEKVLLDDVVLDEDTKETIVKRIDEFLGADDYTTLAKGMIFTGPPGTGKTFLVKALANEKNCYFMSPSLADLKAEFVGQTSAKVKRIFQRARANAPTIMFIDEADTIFPSRDFSGGDSDSFAKDMVNQFLVEIDGMQSGDSKVYVIAATNRINILDSAIRSRLGEPIEIPLPNKEQRKTMFAKKLEKENMDFRKFRFIDEFLDKTNRMSGRDIKNFISNLGTEAKKVNKNISDYKDEAETRELFYNTLSEFEESLVRDLSSKLNIVIQRPGNGPKYSDIIGCQKAKDIINRQVGFFEIGNRERAEKYGIKPKKGILLYGPSGNGKSQLAEAASNEHDLYFMKISSEVFTRATINEQSQILIKIFDSAMQLSEMCSKQKGVLLFFDEFDSLVSTALLDPRVRGTVLTQLSDEKTLRNPRTRIIFMAATNYFDKLDDAAVRMGRIDDRVEIDNPNDNEGAEMIKQFISMIGNVEDIDDGTAKKAYGEYKKKFVNDKKESFIKKYEVEWSLNNAGSIKDYVNIRFKNERPSGADLRNFTNSLVENAFYSKSMSDDGRLLKITDDVIDSVCAG